MNKAERAYLRLRQDEGRVVSKTKCVFINKKSIHSISSSKVQLAGVKLLFNAVDERVVCGMLRKSKRLSEASQKMQMR